MGGTTVVIFSAKSSRHRQPRSAARADDQLWKLKTALEIAQENTSADEKASLAGQITMIDEFSRISKRVIKRQINARFIVAS